VPVSGPLPLENARVAVTHHPSLPPAAPFPFLQVQSLGSRAPLPSALSSVRDPWSWLYAEPGGWSWGQGCSLQCLDPLLPLSRLYPSSSSSRSPQHRGELPVVVCVCAGVGGTSPLVVLRYLQQTLRPGSGLGRGLQPSGGYSHLGDTKPGEGALTAAPFSTRDSVRSCRNRACAGGGGCALLAAARWGSAAACPAAVFEEVALALQIVLLPLPPAAQYLPFLYYRIGLELADSTVGLCVPGLCSFFSL
jgi:hypothetical protein